jgi:hypothetical protein
VSLNPAYDPQAWNTFAMAQVGAAAALAGLLVVATSINISRVIELPHVVQRLGGTLAMFTAVLLTGTTVLVPAQSRMLVGVEIAVIGAAASVAVIRLRGLKGLPAQYRRDSTGVAAAGILAAALLAVAGILTAVGVAGGLYWLVPSVALGYIFGLVNAWVALVEILR